MSTPRTTPSVPRLWRGGPAVRPEVRKAVAKRRRVFALQAAIMALAGAIVGMLYWIKPIPAPRLVPLLAGATESRALAPLPMAEADLSAFERLGIFSLRGKATAGEDRIRFLGSLDDLKSVRNLPVVVSLRAYSRVKVLPPAAGEEAGVVPGQVMILPADADPMNPAKWVSLRTALKALAASRSASKLLLLDVVQPPGDPASDLLTAGLAGRIEKELQEVADPYRLTLTACAPGESALASDDLGRSVFGFYLEEGLRGWADLDATGVKRDGIVTAADLAGFVSAHVDRWARQNRLARQRPLLYRDGARVEPAALGALDFPLAVLPRGVPRPHLTLARARAYPAWLATAWRRLDHWRRGGSERVAPWGFRKVEAAVGWADQSWRSGTDPARVKTFLDAELSAFVAYQEKARAGPRPDPHSLALLIEEGVEPAPALVADVRAFAARAGEPAPAPAQADDKKEKAGAGPAAAADASDRDLALAVFRAAAELPEPSAQAVVALDAVLKPRGAPRFVETLALRRLAEQAALSPEEWSPAAAHRLLVVVRKAGKAENRALPLAWVRRTLDQAAQARHDGEVMFRERGFASIESADTRLGEAERLYDVVLAAEDTIVGAREAFDEATALLPACAPYLEDAPQLEGPWSAAVAAARDVDADLRVGAGGDVSVPLSELTPRVDALRQKSETLQARLAEIREYLAGRAVALAKPGGGDPDAATCAAIDALLATPLPAPEARTALWSVRHDLSRRLADETLKLDHATGWTAPAEDDDDADAVDRLQTAAAARRARRSIDLLALGGLGDGDISALDAALGRATASGTDADWIALAAGLRKAWVDRLPAALKAALAVAADPAAADRLARVLPPFAFFSGRDEVVSRLEDVATNPARRLRIALDARLWSWLADRYLYDATDLDDSDLLNEAARGYRNLSPPSQPASVRFARAAELPELTPERPAAELTLQLQVSRPGGDTPEVTLDTPGLDARRLRVSPSGRSADGAASTFPLSLPAPPNGSLSVPIRVEMQAAGSGAAGPSPLGFLVRARVNGRSFHVRVPATLLSASERLKVLLSDDPETPTAPRGDLRLRPAEGRQTFYLYLFNPTATARKVSVQIKAGDLAVPGGTATAVVGPRAVEKIDFTPPGVSPPPPTAPGAAPAPEPELPLLKAPLNVTVTEADKPERVLSRRQIRVEIASAAEYLRVTEAKFRPTGPGDEKNALTVTLNAIGTLTGPPCRVELVLPPERIPVLVEPPTEGTFRGALPADGTGFTLRAEGLKLASYGSEKGTFHVNVDARKRALVFRNTFGSRGDATTPRLDFEPALRLRAADAAATGMRFVVDVEVDNPPPSSTLDVNLGRIGPGGFEPDVVFPPRAPYLRRVGFAVRGGALAFDATESDWSIPIDTAGIEGVRALRARLFRADGSLVREAVRSLTLDSGAPSDVAFIDLPSQVRKGSALAVRASCRPSESGARQAVFFVGTPTPDGKLPADAKGVEGQPVGPDRKVWSATLRLPEDRKGPTPISVQFQSGIGRAAFATAEVELLDGEPVVRGDLLVRVNEGDRAQPFLDLVVYDAKGAFKAKGLTDSQGHCLIGGLEAGDYVVAAAKPSTPAIGRASVTVVAGTTTTLDLPLLFQSR